MNPQEPPASASQNVKNTAAALASEAKQQTAEMAEQAKTQVASAVESRKAQAADRIGQFAGAVLQAAHTFDESGQKTIARSALSVAQKADDVSRYVRDKDIGDIVDDASAFVRRYPVVFIGATFAAGILLARFLKSSQRRPLEEDDFAPARTAEAWAEV
jgi:hypothetical protein